MRTVERAGGQPARKAHLRVLPSPADKHALVPAVVRDIVAELEAVMVAALSGIGDRLGALCAPGSAYV